jgi:pyrimidine operon attenuation protein / uracil phosphoribosyltransferase
MGTRYLRQIMSAQEMDIALTRMASEIVADHKDLDRLGLVGIRRRGVPLAEILQRKIKAQTGRTAPLGELDITFYRDDLSMVAHQPRVEASRIEFEVADMEILLVDDVLYTGRTTRAALDSVLDYGRPKRIELAALIDRGRRELPIQADYVGQYVETAENEVIEVRVQAVDGEEGVYLTTRELLLADGADSK